jgi:NADPH:quinone reductase-like Zn-dependent oxidoreductase
MRAFAIDRIGTKGTLHDLPMPSPERGELLVRVTAAGVNPIDWKLAEGAMPGEFRFPHVLGQDFAGFVERVGPDVRALVPGTRVFGIARTHGAYSEYTVVAERSQAEPVAPIPEGLSDAQAAALPTAGLTALAALEAASPGHDADVVIVGATGGVGSFTMQLAHHSGIRVIATTHSGKEELARSLGANEVIAYDRTDVVAAIKTRHPGGVEAVIDLVSDREHVQAFAEVLRPGGRIVSTTHALDEAWFKERGFIAHNIALSKAPQSSPESLELLAQMVLNGTLKIALGVQPLEKAQEALQLSRTGTVSGKLVLTV